MAFAATGAVGTNATTNEITSNFTSPINSLWYQQQGETTGNYIHSTLIDAGQTLKIAGSDTNTLRGANGPYSLIAGNFGSSTTMQSWTYISGAGTLDVSNATGGNTGGDIFVRETQGGSGGPNPGANSAQLNLSGLATFNANVDQVLIGYASTYSSGADGERANGVMYLAQSNTLTINSPASAYATSKLNTGLVVGYANHNASPTTAPSILYLGHTNVINVDDITVGAKRQEGMMLFNPAMPGSSVTIRGVSATRVDQIVIGDDYDVASGSTSDGIGIVDLRGGSVDIMASSIILGRGSPNATTTASRAGRGTLYMDTGTIDTTSLVLGDQIGDWNATHNGYITISGGHLIVNSPSGPGGGSLILGYSIPTVTAANGTSSGTLNISGGLVDVYCDMIDGGTVTHPNTTALNLTAGTLDMWGHVIGSVSTPIDTVSLANGTLDNIAQINAGALTINSGVTLDVLVSGPLTLGSTYDILNWVTESGTFATVNLPTLDPSLTWDSSKLYVDGTIQIVPEPAALLMLIMAAGLGLMFKRLRRK